jgi:mevalonate kinase
MAVSNTGTAHGKLLLFGEHAVVYGHPALGITLPLSTTVTLSSTDTPRKLDDACQILDRFITHMSDEVQQRWDAPSQNVQITSNVPMGQGFGSSAALTGAAARALLAPDSEAELIWQQAHAAERAFHGRPSGVDTTLALAEGLTAFQPQTQGMPISSPLPAGPFTLVVGSLPRKENTKALIAQAHARRQANTEATDHLEQLGVLAATVIDQLPQQRDAAAWLGNRAQAAQARLSALGLSTPELDRLIDSAGEIGATGGKLSGAGGGGAFILFCPDAHVADTVAHSLQRPESTASPVAHHVYAYRWTGTRLESIG